MYITENEALYKELETAVTRRLDETIENNEAKTLILEEGSFLNGYRVQSVLFDKGGEAVVYTAERNAKKYVIKIYRYNASPSAEKIALLRNIDSPHLAKLIDSGTINNCLYEIFDYFSGGTLDEIEKPDLVRFKKYVRQLNEGLHALHTGGAGIVHGDIKPSNVFLSEDRERLIIGDYGLSMLCNGRDNVQAGFNGTLEYAPPAIVIGGRVTKTPAFDYGSLGLLLYKLATGYSCMAGLSPEAITLSWNNGIKIPDSLDTGVKNILAGLLCKDESMRYGYEEVKDWCDGAFVSAVKRKTEDRKKKREIAPLWFGIVNEQVIEVTSMEELVSQMCSNWEQAKNKLRDSYFYRFVDNFIPNVSKTIKAYNEECNPDEAVFKTIYTLGNSANIVYKGISYGSVESFMKRYIKSPDSDMEEVISSGMLCFYMNKMSYDEKKQAVFEEILTLENFPAKVKLQILSIAFESRKTYNSWKDYSDMQEGLSRMKLSEIENISDDPKFIAWLYVIGYRDEATELVNCRGEKK